MVSTFAFGKLRLSIGLSGDFRIKRTGPDVPAAGGVPVDKKSLLAECLTQTDGHQPGPLRDWHFRVLLEPPHLAINPRQIQLALLGQNRKGPSAEKP